MKKDRIKTLSFRAVKQSLKRFFSLFIMSLLGVCVFVGIGKAAPFLMNSLDKYYDETKFYDIKLLSTLGFTDNDILEISKLKNIDKVIGTYSKDVEVKTSNTEYVIKINSLSNDINNVKLVKGRMPKERNEIVVEEAMLSKEKLKIGDFIEIKANDLNNTELKIVGTIKSPLYINNGLSVTSRGNTNLGNGKIKYFTYANEELFNLDFYTEAYVLVKDAKDEISNSKKYNELISSVNKEINEIKFSREENRYNEIYNEAKDKIDKEKNKGLNELAKAESELSNANKLLKDGKNKLDLSKKELHDAEYELLLNKEKLDNAKLELDKNEKLLNDAKHEIEKGKKEFNDALSEYNITLDDLNRIEDKILDTEIPKEDLIAVIPDDIPRKDEIIDLIDKVYEYDLKNKFFDFLKSPNKKDDIINSIPKDIPNYDEVVNDMNELLDSNIYDDIKNIVTNDDVVDDLINIIPNTVPGYDDIVNALEEYKNNNELIFMLGESIIKLKEAEEQYDRGIELLNEGKKEYNNGYDIYNKYYNEYENGLSKYNNGENKYISNLNLYQKNIIKYYNAKQMFNIKINDAYQELDKIPKAEWYIFDRSDDSGYASFIDSGNSVSNLSKLFPTIFFIVSILISLISMSRMVEEDRTLIGCLKSLGFNNKHIRMKYIIYSGSATLLGGITGALLGFYLLPLYIWNIYKILFDVPVYAYDYNINSVIVGILIALICICGTTLLTIRKVVKEKPSELMRPKSPSDGKRILLERIPMIWNKFNFSNKITVRNLFRYKKRAILTIGGIMGCTALMLCGFGIRDSIINIPEKQYNEIFHFDEMVYVKPNLTEDKIDDFFTNNNIKDVVKTNIVSMSVNGYETNLFVPFDDKELNKVLNLKCKQDNNVIKLKDNEIVITDKLAQLLNVKITDEIKLNINNKIYKYKISNISENYVGHFVFMNKDTYEKDISKYNTNISYLNLKNIKKENKTIKELLLNKEIMSIMSVDATIDSIDDTLSSLNSVIFILIFLSGALSLVVLYNLSNISISERTREIATLKVLGFTDKEVDSYINKETVILTVAGIIFGLVFGTYLTYIVINTVELEIVRFLHNINPISYIITSLLILLFTFIVNVSTHFSLKKVDMIESLKSVE